METQEKTIITVEATINAPIAKVWEFWSKPEHITTWCSPSADWHTPRAENDLRVGGSFSSRMESRDGSMGFDFGGIYDNVKTHEFISYTIEDGRRVEILFTGQGNNTSVSESFEAESMNSLEMQQGGWQAILNNFKKYTESN